MALKTLLDLILRNEHLTRGLDDAEARMLIEWLVAQTERLYADEPQENQVRSDVLLLCRRARAIARFVALWCHEGAFGTALQLAGAERFAWPLPTRPMDPCDLMNDILTWSE